MPGKIVVVGDVMLDRLVLGDAARLAQEAPIPVIKAEAYDYCCGGAANVASNIATLNGDCILVGLIGKDSNGERLIQLLDFDQVEHHLIPSDGYTTTKTRLYSGRHLIARYDEEAPKPIPEEILKVSIDYLRSGKVGLLVLSDYDKGALVPWIIPLLIEAANSCNIKVLVDPKSSDFSIYSGATIIKPNLKEASAAQPGYYDDFDFEGSVEKLGIHLCKNFKFQTTLITCGIQGLVWCTKEGDCYHEEAWHPKAVFDVTGAGDTAMAALAVSLIENEQQPVQNILKFVAKAAGIAVGQPGTTSVDRHEVDSNEGLATNFNKVFSSVDALKKYTDNLDFDSTFVLSLGCFDAMHIGHIKSLEFAAAQGQFLAVLVNTDESVKRLKGSDRPIFCLKDRMNCLAALSCVSAVAPFEGDDPTSALEALKPDILVKGSQYVPANIPGASSLEKWGGELLLAPYCPGYSTTSLIEKLKPALKNCLEIDPEDTKYFNNDTLLSLRFDPCAGVDFHINDSISSKRCTLYVNGQRYTKAWKLNLNIKSEADPFGSNANTL